MRTLVCGGRHFADRERVFGVLDRIHGRRAIECIVHGGAKGTDSLAGEWAIERRVPSETFLADWVRHGKKAGPIRNQEMLDSAPRLVVAFPGGRGTADMVGRARKAGVTVVEVVT